MVFWITWMFQPYRTKVKSGLSNYSNEPHPQIHQHGRLLTAIPHSTWAGKKWECLLLVIVCLIGIIMNITVGNIGVWLLFICHKLFDMYTPTCEPLSSLCLSSEVDYDQRRKRQKEGGVITRGVMDRGGKQEPCTENRKLEGGKGWLWHSLPTNTTNALTVSTLNHTYIFTSLA